MSGRSKEALAANPHDPMVAIYLLQVATGHYFCKEYEKAVDAAKRVIRSYPDFPLSYRWLAAGLGQLGRIREAREALDKAIAIAPALFDLYVRGQVPWMRPEDRAHMLEGLRKASWEG